MFWPDIGGNKFARLYCVPDNVRLTTAADIDY